jgi:DNA-binding MarR family transcriptional regulator
MTRRLPPAPLAAHLGFWLRFVSNHVSQSFAHKLQGKDVSVAEWAIMRELYDSRKELPSALATKLGLTRGAISKIVDRLVDKQLAARIKVDGDGRSLAVQLSAKGRRLVPTLAALADANEVFFFDHLTRDERATMQRLLRSIVDRRELKAVPVD